ELLEQLVEIGGEGVVVVARASLARTAEASAVVGNHAVPGGEERGRLLFPRCSAQRPPVDQDNGRSGPMVFVIEVDSRGILFAHSNRGHSRYSLQLRLTDEAPR